MTSVEAPSPPARPTVPAEVATLLLPGEEIRWSAQPRPYVFMLRGIPNIAYGVTWGVLGAFWYRGTGGIGKYSAFEGWWRLTPLFSVPFILAGFSFFLYPIRLGARARRTWYLVTNQRVFIAELLRNQPPRLRVFTTGEIAATNLISRSGRLSDITFSRSALINPHLQPRLEDGFFGVENGEEAMTAVHALNAPPT